MKITVELDAQDALATVSTLCEILARLDGTSPGDEIERVAGHLDNALSVISEACFEAGVLTRG